MTTKILYKEDLTIKDLISAIDQGGEGYVALIDNKQKLIGLLTDGDLRRSILNNYPLDKTINFKPKSINQNNLSRQELIQKFKDMNVRILPVIDNENTLINVITDHHLNIDIIEDVQVVIMAGGLGSRLGNITKKIPKPMIKVVGKPILETVITNFKNCGLKNFIISVNYLSDQIIDYFGDGSKFGVNIKYVSEEKRLGTAGSLSLMKDTIKVDNIIIANADVVTTIDYEKFINFHKEKKSDISLVAREIEINIPFGVICSHESDNVIDEKPSYKYDVNSGIYMINKSILEYLSFNEYKDMPSLINYAKKQNKRINTYKIDEYWIDLGKKDDLENFNEDMSAYE